MNNSEDYLEFRAHTLPILESYGREIGNLAKENNTVCKRIIENYGLLRKSYDPFTHQLIKMDLDTFLHEQE